MFDCSEGICQQFHAPWTCERKCPDFNLDSFGNEGVSVAIVSGDQTLLAKCGSVWKMTVPDPDEYFLGSMEDEDGKPPEMELVWRNRNHRQSRDMFQVGFLRGFLKYRKKSFFFFVLCQRFCTYLRDTLDGNIQCCLL